ncbi:hypothetical protein [Paenibacillus sp. RUD330]|uniref:hypothetical protein n=1 Tax=Paenibacillus sp. RUD330 TaxID=2023772 RepID=UPI000B927B9A|nr:hypothetical protein [Paenibacillus sp. RUD330]ASS64714.1 hypothetical protein CIC07_00265 [Paenibacillus sp. RUD330]
MLLEEAGRLLVIISNFVPNYQPTAGAAASWKRILGVMSYEDAERYMYQYFSQSRFAPMPADLLELYRNDFDPDKLVPLDPPDDMMGVGE